MSSHSLWKRELLAPHAQRARFDANTLILKQSHISVSDSAASERETVPRIFIKDAKPLKTPSDCMSVSSCYLSVCVCVEPRSSHAIFPRHTTTPQCHATRSSCEHAALSRRNLTPLANGYSALWRPYERFGERNGGVPWQLACGRWPRGATGTCRTWPGLHVPGGGRRLGQAAPAAPAAGRRAWREYPALRTATNTPTQQQQHRNTQPVTH